MWLIILVVLTFLSYWDIKTKQLPAVWLYMGMIASIGVAILRSYQERDITLLFYGLLPGALLLLFSWGSREKVGKGDGMVLLMIGSLMGLEKGVMILFFAVVFSFGYSLVMLVVFRKQREYRFPFVPFLLLGAIVSFTCIVLSEVS